jgi:prepilin-type N-terminal cleavage/methylation domain-containing protein
MSACVTPAHDQRGGFTLLEVVMSMMILTYGVLGLAGTTLHVTR